MLNIPKFIIVHHSVTPRDLDKNRTESSINTSHKERFKDPKTGVNNYKSSMGWYVGYHFMIFGDGEMRQYRGENDVGVHCAEESMNFKSIGICLIGDFSNATENRLDEMPTPAQIATLSKLVRAYQAKFNIPDENVVPHRHFAKYKDCYGNKLPDNPIELFPNKELSDLEWAKKHLPEVDWDLTSFSPKDVASAIRALGKRVVWRS